MKIVITGGHHSSAMPVIEQLKKAIPDVQIYWFGHKYTLLKDKNPTLEYLEITKLKIPFIEFHAGKFYKTFNIKRLALIPYGFFQALFLLLKLKPDVIVSFGGYLAVPVVLAGWLLKIPSVTHEQTLVTGYANNLIAKFAKKIMVSWKESLPFFPTQKTVYTGIPLRKSIFTSISHSFDTTNGLPTIYITGGKTGSHNINLAVMQTLKDLLAICNVIHQCGDYSEYHDFDKLTKVYSDINTDKTLGRYFLRKFVFEDEIGEALNKSVLVVSRAGAHIVSELYALKKPCLLIPIPWVSHNEQQKNAELLKNIGLAEILEEKYLNGTMLYNNISNMLEGIEQYNQKVLENSYVVNSAEKIADGIIKASHKAKNESAH